MTTKKSDPQDIAAKDEPVSPKVTRAASKRPPAPPEPSLMDEKVQPHVPHVPVNLIPLALEQLKSTLRDRTGITKFESDENVHDYLRLKIGHIDDREVFGVIWLDGQGSLIEDVMLAEGGLTETHIAMKRVLRSALDFKAHAGIVYHNHPSGYADPSDNDIKLTERLGAMLGMLEIELVDHYIIGCDSELKVGSVKDYVSAKNKAKEDEQEQLAGELRRHGIDVPEGARIPPGLVRILKMLHSL